MYNFLKQPNKNPNGMVLVITIIVLVVLSTMVYTLSSKIWQRLRRDQYLIDYQTARYACDSAIKYSLAIISELNPEYIDRVNEPDFSDLFRMNEDEYNQMIKAWQIEQGIYDYNQTEPVNDGNIYDINEVNNLSAETDNAQMKTNAPKKLEMLSYAELMDLAMQAELPAAKTNEPNDVNDANDFAGGFNDSFGGMADFFEMFAADGYQKEQKFYVKGPYGPQYPMVKPKVEFEFSSAQVEIEIEDENAKFPLVWAVMKDEKYDRQAKAAVKSFFEWMGLDSRQIENITEQLKEAAEIKEFSTEMKPIIITKTTTQKVAQKPARRTSRRSRRTRKTTQPQTRQVVQKSQRDNLLHYTDFSKVFNSNVLDVDMLKEPSIQTADRIENPYKYISLFSADKVNINTAPRHILEAAFKFGGDEVEIADLIIKRRKEKPFKDIEDLEKELMSYRDSIEKVKPFIITKSNVFLIKVKAYSGTASATAFAAVLKDGNKVDTISVIRD
jgi:type II secretory pathway component PulK